MNKSYKMVSLIELETVNRGRQMFTISQSDKGYFAHELGELTEISKVTGGAQQYAHKLNKSVRRGNQYGRYWKPKPYQTIDQARERINEVAQTNVRYC